MLMAVDQTYNIESKRDRHRSENETEDENENIVQDGQDGDGEYHNCQANTVRVNGETTHDADIPTPTPTPRGTTIGKYRV